VEVENKSAALYPLRKTREDPEELKNFSVSPFSLHLLWVVAGN